MAAKRNGSAGRNKKKRIPEMNAATPDFYRGLWDGKMHKREPGGPTQLYSESRKAILENAGGGLRDYLSDRTITERELERKWPIGKGVIVGGLSRKRKNKR